MSEYRKTGDVGGVSYIIAKSDDGGFMLRLYSYVKPCPSLFIHAEPAFGGRLEDLFFNIQTNPYLNTPTWFKSLQVEPIMGISNPKENTFNSNLYATDMGVKDNGSLPLALRFVTTGDPTYNHYPINSEDAFLILRTLILTGQF